jgi:ABC-type uncharacterized transport system substrate-binding protein
VRRRDFITLLGGAVTAPLLAAPLAAQAQSVERVRRIGVFLPLAADEPEAKARITTFRKELERLGWTEERNVLIDLRFGAGRSEQYAALAQELVALQPDVIVGQSTRVAATLQQATSLIPIVFNNVSDPILEGFVTSLRRPGGNLTGLLLYESGIVGKWLAMLKEIAPGITRVALVGNPRTMPFDHFARWAEAAAPSLAIELVPVRVENTAAAIERGIESFAPTSNSGLLCLPDPTLVGHRELVAQLAIRHRQPAVYPFRFLVEAGGLMSYGTDQLEAFRLSATYVDRILRGAKPADLPVQAPTKYQTLVNLKAAKAIGFDVPSSLLLRADEVIE